MPTITPEHAAAYLRHTVGREPIREIARAEGVHASTVLRRVRSIEDARDCPVWSQIWDDISRAYAAPAATIPPGFGFDALLAYLGTDAAECAGALALTVRAPRSSLFILVGSETPRAPILRRDERVATITRAAALGLVLIGAARCQPGQGSTRVARLELTGNPVPALENVEAVAPFAPPTEDRPAQVRYETPHGAALIGQMERPKPTSTVRFEAEHIALAQSMLESAQFDASRFLDAIADLNMGEMLTPAFKALIVDGMGFEATEKALGWPARSAKLAFLIGLDLARARGFAG